MQGCVWLILMHKASLRVVCTTPWCVQRCRWYKWNLESVLHLVTPCHLWFYCSPWNRTMWICRTCFRRRNFFPLLQISSSLPFKLIYAKLKRRWEWCWRYKSLGVIQSLILKKGPNLFLKNKVTVVFSKSDSSTGKFCICWELFSAAHWYTWSSNDCKGFKFKFKQITGGRKFGIRNKTVATQSTLTAEGSLHCWFWSFCFQR